MLAELTFSYPLIHHLSSASGCGKCSVNDKLRAARQDWHATCGLGRSDAPRGLIRPCLLDGPSHTLATSALLSH